MRKRSSYLIGLLWLAATLLQAQTNRALIIAISDYSPESGWDETHATNDCKLVIPMLKANGYKKTDITSLLNEQATKAGIVKELKKLEEKARPGDYIYIHLSGHGQQMADNNGDEPDGLDEAFIPYDARFRYSPGRYEGKSHLRDDELELLINAIRRRTGEKGRVTVVLDACHSGTGTRDPEEDEYIRGTSYIFAPPGYKIVSANPGNFSLSMKTGKGLSPVTIFSACQPDQFNYEYKSGNPATYYGSLSFFFCESAKSRQQESAYSFYLRLRHNMEHYFRKKRKEQSPYFETTGKGDIFTIGKPK